MKICIIGTGYVGLATGACLASMEHEITCVDKNKKIVEALKNLKRGGRLVVNAIRKEEFDKNTLLELDYAKHLWLEKEIKSVANVTRRDVREFLDLAAQIPIEPELVEFRLEDANRALLELKERKIRGAKVLKTED